MGNIEDINNRFRESVKRLIVAGDARNKTAIANSLNIKKSKFSEILNYRMNVSIVLISDYCEAYNVSLEWILYDRGGWRKSTVEAGEYIQSRTLKTHVQQENQIIPIYNLEAITSLIKPLAGVNEIRNIPIGHISLPNLPKCDGSSYMNGNNMAPLLNKGDILVYKIINDIEAGILWGETYVISHLAYGEEIVTIRCIQKSDKGDEYVKLVSVNTKSKPIEVEKKSIKALAMVKASVRHSTLS